MGFKKMVLIIVAAALLFYAQMHNCYQLDKYNYEIKELLEGNSTSLEHPLHCVHVRNPYTYSYDKTLKDYIKCCRVYNEVAVSIKCAPSFIIAGTQKSGTTALSAYLSSLPTISFAPRKEIHFFDKKDYKNDLASYLNSFNNWDYTQYYNPPYFGEASPAYIANRHACQRLHDMIPNIKVIVLLREPIARAYSEYQMKKRRVNQQNEFLGLVESYKTAVHNCLVTIPSTQPGNTFPWKIFKECLPTELVSHPHFDKFAISINKHYKNDQGLHNILQKCFSRSNSSGDSSWDKSRIIPTISQDNDTNDAPRRRRRRTTRKGDKIDLLSRRGDNITFHPLTCMGKYAREKLISLTEAFPSEVERLNSCPGLTSLNISESNTAIDSCVSITAGISKDFVYRSMYALQLYHCFQHIPRRQFLILPSERLQNNATTEAAIKEITNFLMIPSDKVTRKSGSGYQQNGDAEAPSKSLDPQSIEALMAKYFPKFQKNTGWKVKSDYDQPMPHTIKQTLVPFFDQYNSKLFQLLHISRYDEWNNEAAASA